MKCIVVDDERPALELLVHELRKCPELEVVGQYLDGTQMLIELPELQPEAIFLDIHMPSINGLQLVPAVRQSCPNAKIIFVTAHAQYAVHAFEEEVFDYVVKPVFRERLDKTVQRLCRGISPATGSIRVFGTLSIQYGPTIVHWQTAKAAEMFAYLLVHNRVNVDRLQEVVFSEFPPDKSKSYIYTCVYMIRNSLQKSGLAKHIRLESGGGSYFLILTDIDNEWANWKSDSYTPSSETLSVAYQRLQHPLFVDIESEWVRTERVQAEEKLIEMCMHCFIHVPFRELAEGKTMLLGLLDFIAPDDMFWPEIVQKLMHERCVSVANELQENVSRLLREQ